jgi:glycerophosphoryl diester phosphodiesterase
MQIIAHRGASYDAPENTLAAARLAWVQGADALEVDVHLTGDDRLAVIHDSDTRRTAGVEGAVAKLTLSDLQVREVGRWKDVRFAGETIPALDDILAITPAGKRVFVEIKSGPESVVALQRCITDRRQNPGVLAHQIAIISFDLAVATAAKRALPVHEVCWIADAGADAPRSTLGEIARDARAAGLDGIDVASGWFLDAKTVQQIQSGGFKLYVWTVDDAPLARRLLAAGVDGLTTNRPGWLRAQLAISEDISSS